MRDFYSILITDDHAMFRRGIASLLSQEYIYRCTEAEDGDQAVHLTSLVEYDLILLDERMARMHGYDAAKLILKRNPKAKIIAFTQYDDLALILNFFKIGVKGYLVKESDPPILISAIRTVLNGGRYVNSRFSDQIDLERGIDKNLIAPTIRFSKRESQIIKLLCDGKTTEEIAQRLSLNFRTVETYRYDLIKKTGLSNSTQLIAYVHKNGFMG